MTFQSFKIVDENVRLRVMAAIERLPLSPVCEITIKEYKKNRNLEQNKKMWAMLNDISNQVVWHGHKLSKENWKDIFSASLKQQQVVPGLDNNFVVLGAHTSKMTISELSELIELMMAFGTHHNVRWLAPDWME